MSGIPYPPNLTPDGGNLVALVINEFWWSVLFGFAKNALNRNLWNVTDEEWINEVEPAVLSMLALDTIMCDGLICDIRFEDGVIEVLKGGEWTPIDGTETIVTGVGITGGGSIEVEQGGEFSELAADCETCPDRGTPPMQKSGEARSCAIAKSLTEWWFEKYLDSLDAAEAFSDIMSAMDAVTAVFPPLYVVADQTSDAINEWVEAGYALANAADTVEAREDFERALYCHLVDNSNEFTNEIWQAFRDDYIPTMNPLLQVYDFFQVEAIVDRAHRASYGEDTECGGLDCSGCVLYVSFENAPETGVYEIMEGTYNTGLHVSDVGVAGADDYLARVRVRFYPDAPVGEITYNMLAVRGSGSPAARNLFQIVRGRVGGVTSTLFSVEPETGTTEGVSYERTRTFTVDTYEWIELEIYCGFTAGVGGELFMDDVCLK